MSTQFLQKRIATSRARIPVDTKEKGGKLERRRRKTDSPLCVSPHEWEKMSTAGLPLQTPTTTCAEGDTLSACRGRQPEQKNV